MSMVFAAVGIYYIIDGDITDELIASQPPLIIFSFYSVLHALICLFTHPAIRAQTLTLWPALTRVIGGGRTNDKENILHTGNVYDAYLKGQWKAGY